MDKLEKAIKESLLNKQLTDIEFFIIGPRYLSPDEEHTWIIDGGVELKLDDTIFSFGWDETQAFFDICSEPLDKLTGETKIQNLEAKNITGISALIGHKIKDLHFKWNFYYEYDDNFELIDEKKYMPFEIVLEFDNNSTVQIATVLFRAQNNTITDLVYDSQGQLLVSLNKLHEIKLLEENN